MKCPFFTKRIEFITIEVFIIFCLLLSVVIVLLRVVPQNIVAKKIEEKIKREEVAIYRVACTAYNPLREQTDKTPRKTAINTEVKENYTVAVSQDLIERKIVNYGDTIYIYEFGKYYSVEDCMNERYTNRVDIFMESKKQARKFGLKIVHFSVIGK